MPTQNIWSQSRRANLIIRVLCVSATSSICCISLADTEPTNAVRTDATPTSAEAKQKAMGHFATGLKLYEDGDFSLALIEFERAYSYVPDYRVLYNIGQVSIQLGRYARAAQALTQYLALGARSVPASRANSVREDLNMLEGRTARLKVTSNVEGAEVLLDDVRLAVTPVDASILVDAGEHRLTLQKAGYTTRTERIVLAGRDDSTLPIDLVELPKAQPQSVAPAIVRVEPQHPKDNSSPQSASTRTQWLYIGAGATGLFAVGWAVTGYIGIKAAGDLHDALKQPSTAVELQSLRNNARAALIASDILGGFALATGATTLYFALSGPSTDPKRDQRHASASANPRSERLAPRSPTSGIRDLNVGLAQGTLQLSGTFF